MQIVPTNMTVADYCHGMERGEIIVNRDYQRSDRVWPDIAKSFLIETIILGFPVPKLSLFQQTDLKTRRTVKEIVDGQQRSVAILQFFSDTFTLSRSLETSDIAGRKLSQLDGEYQSRFIDYSLSLDLFVGASPEDVREIFRRMNSYTVPLNPEEQRHASYQGPFKWFIYRMAHEYDTAFLAMGVFSEKQIVRMNDAKLLTELCHALLYGISTTNKRKLDSLYRSRDGEYLEEPDHEARLEAAIDFLITLEEIHGSSLAKPYMMYSLILAVMHAQQRVESLITAEVPGGDGLSSHDTCVQNLSLLSDGLGQSEPDTQTQHLEEFVKASESKTNTAHNRGVRFEWLYRAITSEQI